MKLQVFLLLALVFPIEVCFAGIQGSKHDFSNSAWNPSGEVCVVCHTPHHADSQYKPLWNHQSTTANFKLYSSPTLKRSPEQPRSASLQCLSCHDGTVAIDSFGGNKGKTVIDQAHMIGVDLSNDHPVSIKWKHQTKQRLCFNCHDTELDLISKIPFYDGYVECATCHDVHNGTNQPKLLRKTMSGSELCLYCHGN